MNHTFLSTLIVGLILGLIYYITARLIKGLPLRIVGLTLGFIFLLSTLRTLNLVSI